MTTGELDAGHDQLAAARPAEPWFHRTAVRRLHLWTVVLIVVSDQLSKAAIRATLGLHESITVIPNLVDLTHVRNTGAAFGFLNTADFPYKGAVVTIMATLALLAIAFYAMKLPAEDRLVRFALALILGGAIGNLIDRALVGYVLDFVDVYWRDWHFWAFNVADSAITIGAVLMILDMLRVPHVPKTL
jgi:signal peptidase II